MPTDIEKIQELVRHINYVQEAGVLLGTRLMELGKIDLGRKLIARCYRHDNSKFFGIEWDYISHHNDEENKERVALAVTQHNRSQEHHPEYWNNISEMDDVSIAEFVCDIFSRSNQFGSSIFTWIEEVAITKYGFTKKDKVYKRIMYFIKILVGKQFRKLPKIKTES